MRNVDSLKKQLHAKKGATLSYACSLIVVVRNQLVIGILSKLMNLMRAIGMCLFSTYHSLTLRKNLTKKLYLRYVCKHKHDELGYPIIDRLHTLHQIISFCVIACLQAHIGLYKWKG